MCLITNQREPYIAKTDIVVYKLVTKGTSDNKYISLYEKYPYELNKVYEEIDNLQENSTNTFGKGWFHSFRTLIAALLVQNNTTIVIGIIPKGTPYYLGMYSDICSKKIKLIREL